MKHISLIVLGLALFGAGCSTGWSSSTPAATTAAPAAVTATTTAPVVKPATTTTAPAAKAPAPATKTQALQPNTKPSKPGPATVYVNIVDYSFSPQIIAINVGDRVVWTNKGAMNHTSVSDNGLLWDSNNIPPGTSYSRTFNAPGSYTYHCGVHPNMKGTVVVH